MEIYIEKFKELGHYEEIHFFFLSNNFFSVLSLPSVESPAEKNLEDVLNKVRHEARHDCSNFGIPAI